MVVGCATEPVFEEASRSGRTAPVYLGSLPLPPRILPHPRSAVRPGRVRPGQPSSYLVLGLAGVGSFVLNSQRASKW